MQADLPIAVVGASWRSVSTTARAKLASLNGGADDPTQALRDGGYLNGAVCLSTCSRTEWLVSSTQPEWAATLLRSVLLARVPELPPEAISVRTAKPALHYVLRVAVGLDSVAEGENAVGRQMLRAFEVARARQGTDRRVRLVWKQVERLIAARRDVVPASSGLGVQALVRETLVERGVQSVAILGRGDFGLSMEHALRHAGLSHVACFSRAEMAQALDDASRVAAVVVCTGGSEPWLTLPAGHEGRLCIDAGSPPQVKAAPGWDLIGLDVLLSRPELQLAEPDRLHLEQLVQDATAQLVHSLTSTPPSETLAAIDAERLVFLNERLPALLEGVPKDQVRNVKRAFGEFVHGILKRARETSS